jgi:hypothetical protein
MTRNQRQEALSRAYVHAVAAMAGFSRTARATDYGIDLSLYAVARRGSRYVETGIVLDVQVKSTTRAGRELNTICYDLDVKANDDLRDPAAHIPLILVLVVLPVDPADWLSQTEEGLTIRRCAYWQSLAGRGPTSRGRTVRLRIPRANVFSSSALADIFKHLGARGEP